MTKWKDMKKKEKYEKRKEEDASFYKAMDNDQLLEEVARKFPGCRDEMCFACLGNHVLLNELKRRLEEK